MFTNTPTGTKRQRPGARARLGAIAAEERLPHIANTPSYSYGSEKTTLPPAPTVPHTQMNIGTAMKKAAQASEARQRTSGSATRNLRGASKATEETNDNSGGEDDGSEESSELSEESFQAEEDMFRHLEREMLPHRPVRDALAPPIQPARNSPPMTSESNPSRFFSLRQNIGKVYGALQRHTASLLRYALDQKWLLLLFLLPLLLYSLLPYWPSYEKIAGPLPKGDDELVKRMFLLERRMNDKVDALQQDLDRQFLLVSSYSQSNNKHDKDSQMAMDALLRSAASRSSPLASRLPDLALYSSGARVNPYLSTPTYVQSPRRLLSRLTSYVLGGVGSTWGHRPVMAIIPDTNLGMCWAFAGSQGQLGVHLARRASITAFSIDHIAISGSHDGSTAPKLIELWAEIDDDRARDAIRANNSASGRTESSAPAPMYVRIAEGVYDIHSTMPIQTFPVYATAKHYNVAIVNVVGRILENWGSKKYTCLYRFRVHGVAVQTEPIDEETEEHHAGIAEESFLGQEFALGEDEAV